MSPLHPRRALGALLVLLTACGGSSTTVEDPVPTTLRLSLETVEFTYLGQSQRVSATLLDAAGNKLAGEISWSSSDPDVADLSSPGVIRAEGNGSATVEASSGGLSATVQVSVQQVPEFLAIVSGNDQRGIAGMALSEPLVVRVQDQGGSPVPEVEVAFTPDPTSGSVDPADGISGADGTVSTTWTLGAPFGPQRVVAAIDVSERELTAFAGSETPTPDLRVLEPVTVTRFDPSTFDTVSVKATVENQGDADALAFRVALLVDGVEVASRELASVAASSETTVEFDGIGPLTAGTRSVEVVVDPDEVVLELNETNNVGARDLIVLLQQEVQPGVPDPSLSADPGESLYFRVDVAGGPTNLTVGLSGGTGDADLWIEGGTRPRTYEEYDDCVSAGPTMEETCQIVDADATYHIVVHAPTNAGSAVAGFSGSTLTVTLGDPVAPFDLELVFIDNGTASQDQAFLDAAARWGEIIVSDVPDYDLGGQTIPSNACIDGMPSISDTVDDVIIYAAIRTIDGPLGTLARAGPCFIRSGSSLPFVGFMEFDKADLDRLELDGDMGEVVLHEMGHVLGIGTIWRLRDLLQAPSTETGTDGCQVTSPDADTHFTGVGAREAFDDAGGVAYGGSKVPVANGELGAGCGSADGHWRESVLDSELMTPFLNGLGDNPLSAITVRSLADLGYGVDAGQAEAYALPAGATQVVGAAEPGSTATTGWIDLGDDLYRGPVWVMEQGGRVVRVLR